MTPIVAAEASDELDDIATPVSLASLAGKGYR
jgi:hypothetical protein